MQRVIAAELCRQAGLGTALMGMVEAGERQSPSQ
jgi:hypothetical protein